MPLPAYQPPCDRRSCLAAGLAPLLVLLGFVLVVLGLIEPALALSLLLTSALWLGHEMQLYQRRLDDYNRAYIQAHLGWRSSATLCQMAQAPGTDEATRDFTQRYLADGREHRPDRPMLS